MSIKDKIKKLSESPSYDFNHIDPVTGLPRVKTRPEDKIHLMNQMPAKSGFIVMLQNRVNFNSIGNKRYSETLWYDRNTRKVSKEKDGVGGVDFRVYHLPNGPKPQGWVYKEEIGRLNEDFFDELSNDLEEPIDDIELLDDGVEKTYKHYASYVL